ncbi:MAG: glycosyltransferase family 4 protein [Lachnospiraceae bacterium]|nr:glycosyltransferase family 4 protein [Lachnospiraceae bacterium]
MRIVIDLTALADNFSGMERYALNLVRELLKQRKEHHYILIFKEEIHEAFSQYKDSSLVETLILPRRNKLWFYQATLYGAVRRMQADLFFFPAFPAPLFLRKKGIVNTIFDMGCWDCADTMTGRMVQYFRLMYRNAARCSSYIVTISEFSKTRIHEILGVAREKILVAPCAVSEEFYQLPAGDVNTGGEKNPVASRDVNTAGGESFFSDQTPGTIMETYHLPEKYILCLSTLEPRKNLKLLIEAYAELAAENGCDYDLVLAGRKGWKMDEVLNHIPPEAVQRIHITGYIEDRDLPPLYSHAKLFVFPSHYEGFGIPPLEAMACGVPVLCSNIEVLREVLGDQAEYFVSDDRESLKTALLDCLDESHVFPPRESLISYSRKYSYKESVKVLERAF